MTPSCTRTEELLTKMNLAPRPGAKAGGLLRSSLIPSASAPEI